MSYPLSFDAQLQALGIAPLYGVLLSEADRRELIRAALREASAADFESESVRRTEAASPDDLPSLPPPSPVPPASAGSAPDLSDAAGSGGGSAGCTGLTARWLASKLAREQELGELRPVCPDCRGTGGSNVWPDPCSTCAGEGRIGGGR